MDNCCRTCLREKRHNQMKLLSTKWNNSHLTFADMLMDIVQINKEISSNETSLKICSSCESDLITAHNFKIVCQNTEKILIERFAQTTAISSLPSIEHVKAEILVLDEESIAKQEIDEKVCISMINECDEKIQKNINRKCKISTIKKKTGKTKPKKEKNLSSKNNKDNTTQEIKSENIIINVCDTNLIQKSKKRIPSVYCQKCDTKFESQKYYQRHCREKHWTTYPCTICGKLFYLSRLKLHMDTHSAKRNHLCTICGAKFLSDSNLKEHIRIHTGEKRYKCNYCEEIFIHWNSRKNHIYKAHTKEKKYECYLCHRLFAQRGTMVIHLKYHLGDLPHVCLVCDKRFPILRELNRHTLTHLNKNRKNRKDSSRPIIADIINSKGNDELINVE